MISLYFFTVIMVRLKPKGNFQKAEKKNTVITENTENINNWFVGLLTLSISVKEKCIFILYREQLTLLDPIYRSDKLAQF